MRLKKISDVKDFLAIIPRCEGEVFVESVEGDRFNLKSDLSRYIALGRIIDAHCDELDLYCSNRQDEQMFLDYFNKHPGVA